VAYSLELMFVAIKATGDAELRKSWKTKNQNNASLALSSEAREAKVHIKFKKITCASVSFKLKGVKRKARCYF